MIILKCKMCGGDLEINEGMSVCECEYCGTKQTIPKYDNDQKINAMNRANHFRRQCEFDKAIEIYEKILQTSGDDSEVYWALALCKYGIEYVDDPVTHKKIPTCHRMQYMSILDDVDYKEAISRADEIRKSVYIDEAETISTIQKEILDISNKEKPFDVFICYKESDETNSRTQDSVLAQDIYYGLSEKGFKVFFSRITLEGKLGTAYEPYIFAALNSAKVMIVVGTKPEYVNSVWVKNEWSRFLMLMQEDRHKMIIPAYRDMDPYDLPDALSVYQSQDMSKLGFMQDLIRGVSKVLEADGNKKEKIDNTTNIPTEVNANIVALIKRGNLALEDAEWDRAFDFFDQVLNSDAENADAYMGQLFAKNKVANKDEFIESLLSKTEKAELTVHSMKISEEHFECIQNMLSENAIVEFSYNDSELKNYTYETYSESRNNQKEQMVTFFETDKLLRKVIRFSEGNGTSILESLTNGVLSVMDARIADAQEHDKIVEQKISEKIDEVYKGLLDRVNIAIKEKSETYDKFVSNYEAGMLSMSYGQIKRRFIMFGDYKDAKKYVENIDAFVSEKEKELYKLVDEKREIMNSFGNLGLFAGKKRAALEARLNEIDSEKEKLEKIINDYNCAPISGFSTK